MSAETTTVRFEEDQYLRQPWLWIVIGGSSLSQILLFGWGLYQQLYLGRPWGTSATSDEALVVIAALVLIIALGIPLLLYTTKLTVRVDATHLRVRYFPFLRKAVPLEQVTRCMVRTYQPLREYGGWGIRWSWTGRGWAYNVSGDRGVQLELASGRRLLIGSQRPNELAEAISAGMNG